MSHPCLARGATDDADTNGRAGIDLYLRRLRRFRSRQPPCSRICAYVSLGLLADHGVTRLQLTRCTQNCTAGERRFLQSLLFDRLAS